MAAAISRGRRDIAVLGSPGVDEGGGLDHEARRAVAALQPVVGGEGALDRWADPGRRAPRPWSPTRPASAAAGSRQLTTGTPSSWTVQAPQTPLPQTSLVPVRPSPSRRTSVAVTSPSAPSPASGCVVPLTVTSMPDIQCTQCQFVKDSDGPAVPLARGRVEAVAWPGRRGERVPAQEPGGSLDQTQHPDHRRRRCRLRGADDRAGDQRQARGWRRGAETGTAKIFMVNPVQSSGNQGLTDQKDAATRRAGVRVRPASSSATSTARATSAASG